MQGGAVPDHLADPSQAFLLEVGVTDREHLVDQEDVRLEKRGDGEAEPHLHAHRIELDLPVDGIGELGELDDLVEALPDGRPGHSEHGAVEEDVLPTGQLRLDPAGHAEQRADPPRHRAPAGRLVGHLADDLEQRGLAGTVDPDQRHASPRAPPPG